MQESKQSCNFFILIVKKEVNPMLTIALTPNSNKGLQFKMRNLKNNSTLKMMTT